MTKTVLKKDKIVKVKTKTGVSYSYSYSTLAEIHRYLEATGQRYEAFIQKVEGEDYMFIRKFSKDDKGEPVVLQGAKIPPVQGVQDYGGVLTSVRRFSLLMAYGLACEDNDSPSPKDTNPKKDWKTFYDKTHTPNPNNPVSDKQRVAIRNLCNQLHKPDAVILELMAEVTNAALASELIDKLVKETKGEAYVADDVDPKTGLYRDEKMQEFADRVQKSGYDKTTRMLGDS